MWEDNPDVANLRIGDGEPYPAFGSSAFEDVPAIGGGHA